MPEDPEHTIRAQQDLIVHFIHTTINLERKILKQADDLASQKGDFSMQENRKFTQRGARDTALAKFEAEFKRNWKEVEKRGLEARIVFLDEACEELSGIPA